MQNYIQSFIKEVIRQAGLNDMPEEFLQEYEERLTIEAQKRLGLAAIKELTDEEAITLAKIAEESNNDPKKIQEFLASHIDNFEEKMAKILADFGKEIINTIKTIQ